MADRSRGGGSFGRPSGSLRSRRPPGSPRGDFHFHLESVTYVPGLKCYLCPRPYIGVQKRLSKNQLALLMARGGTAADSESRRS